MTKQQSTTTNYKMQQQITKHNNKLQKGNADLFPYLFWQNVILICFVIRSCASSLCFYFRHCVFVFVVPFVLCRCVFGFGSV